MLLARCHKGVDRSDEATSEDICDLLTTQCPITAAQLASAKDTSLTLAMQQLLTAAAAAARSPARRLIRLERRDLKLRLRLPRWDHLRQQRL